MSQNITYTSDEILKFYSANRQAWADFYPSEQWVFEHIAGEKGHLGGVFDVGCAGGGLGAALCERFNLESYTGIDIHQGIIDWAKEHRALKVDSDFIAGDISTLNLDRQFDLVVSLGCADWNIETDKIIGECWDKVKPGGYFVVSLRLTTARTVNDITKSFQYINFSGNDREPEKANYVVTNYREAIVLFSSLNPLPEIIGAYGYWGNPSSTAQTPFERILFSVFYIRKGAEDKRDCRTELFLPADVYTEERDD
ncbi:MAG: class I SAM-dependent methyltransferase [Candidatus Omnitrophota bacterium]